VRLIHSNAHPIADAIAVIELDGLARGARLVDDLLKAAQVRMLASEVYSGPRFILLFDGEVEALNQAYQAGLVAGGNRVVDAMLLAQAHSALSDALAGCFAHPEHADDAILLVETETVAATLRSADAALKAVPVVLSSWRLGRGLGGRGLFALRGEHANLEAAQSVVLEAAGAGLRETQLIPRPDPLGLWARPFGGDQP
jgi:microcompartment protein CcmL/EutN